MDIKQKIQEANQEAFNRIVAADPVLIDVAPAHEIIPGLKDKMILHSGPPVAWKKMSGAQKGAVIGIVIFEEWAKTRKEAEKLIEAGEIVFEPNHHHQAVGPMAGTISKSMWVFVVENKTFANRAYCRQIEEKQQFGDFSEDALQSLIMWRDVWAPSIRAGLKEMGGLSLKPIIARALQMGDELHNRQTAGSSLFANAIVIPMIKAGVPEKDLISTMGLLTNHELFFLGLSMSAAKASVDPARGIEYSTIVTAMARNGTEFGIHVSGLEGEWFTAPAPPVKGLFLPGFKEGDQGMDIGDSAITETVGWGGFVLGGAPGILSFVGGTPDEALAYSREMREITVSTSPDFLIPALGFEGTAVGIDIRKVVRTNILPIIDTAMAHKEPGHPIIGAGLVRPPIECFKKALTRFAEKYN
jgi:hypothetical protein